MRGKLIDLSVPKVVGILNVTPDSFFDGGRNAGEKLILEHVEKMLTQGADCIDVGGYSSRPGATHISEAEEASRVLPVIKLILSHFPGTILSIDTFRSTIARNSVDAGASIINDISGGEQDPLMFETVASLKVPYVLMHMRGTPATMNTLTDYSDLLREILFYFQNKLDRLHQLGVRDVILDPGFGFAKTISQNFEILGHLDFFHTLECPLLVGLSRKSMISKTLAIEAADALNGTTALNTMALLKGASLLRVHDVKEAVECVRLFQKLQPVR